MLVPEIIMDQEEQWDKVILPKKTLFHLPYKELWSYRDLLFLFVKRDFVAAYKQSILGPAWHVIQPILTTAIYVVVFNRIANISTDGVPPVLFYFAGITLWQFFATCLTSSSSAFIANVDIFSKVYFPRLIIPLSSMMSAMVALVIRLGLLLMIYGYFIFTGSQIHPNINLMLLPLTVVILGILGLGFGVIVSSLTTKYRDLSYLVGFGVQLLMYATPVIYPMSALPEEFRAYAIYNPVAPLIESFRYGLTGFGSFSMNQLIFSFVFALVLLTTSVFLFNKVENSFVDTL